MLAKPPGGARSHALSTIAIDFPQTPPGAKPENSISSLAPHRVLHSRTLLRKTKSNSRFVSLARETRLKSKPVCFGCSRYHKESVTRRRTRLESPCAHFLRLASYKLVPVWAFGFPKPFCLTHTTEPRLYVLRVLPSLFWEEVTAHLPQKSDVFQRVREDLFRGLRRRAGKRPSLRLHSSTQTQNKTLSLRTSVIIITDFLCPIHFVISFNLWSSNKSNTMAIDRATAIF